MGSLPNLHELIDKEDESGQKSGKLPDARDRAACVQCKHCSHHKHKHHHPPGHRSHHPPLLKTKSAGSAQHNCIGSIDRPDEDSILERMASYSPISNRSTRSNSTLHHHQLHSAYAVPSTSRIRGDSMSSSAGNSSVRKLIAVVRSTPSKYGPIYSRKVLCRNFGALCLGHMLMTAALVPLFALQGSISAWYWPSNFPGTEQPDHTTQTLIVNDYSQQPIRGDERHNQSMDGGDSYDGGKFKPFLDSTHSYYLDGDVTQSTTQDIKTGAIQINTNVGSLLLSLLFVVSTLSILLSLIIIRKLGINWCIIISYIFMTLFLSVHIYPKLYVLIIGYFIMGLWLGPLTISRVTFLMTLASKLSYVLSEREEEEMDESYLLGRKEIIVHRLSRYLTFSSNFGLMLGNIITAIVLYNTDHNIYNLDANNSIPIPFGSLFSNKNGDKICGSEACPLATVRMDTAENSNFSGDSDGIYPVALSCKTSTLLTSIFVGCGVMSVALSAAFIDKIRIYVFQDHLGISTDHSLKNKSFFAVIKNIFKDPKLQLAAPLSIFIGLEQAFIYTDFTKWYVVCAVELQNVSLVLLSLGLLQSVAAFTLSMLLQHVRRYFVIGVGFAFHSCLILVLLQWKPSKDDPALFYVIAAAWGVCNAIWDTLNFSLIVSMYPDTWQAPFAHSFFFRFLGLALAFGAHGAICNWIKLYGLAAALVLAVIPYSWLEWKLEVHRRSRVQMTKL